MLLDYIIYFSHGKGDILVCCQDINSLIKMKVANERLRDVFLKGAGGIPISVKTHTSQILMKLSKFNETVK